MQGEEDLVFSSQKETLVGALTFLAFVIIVLASYGRNDSAGNDQVYQVSATFGRIDGLVEESEVRMGGVPIGHVLATKLNENYRAVVVMGIDRHVALPLDTSAAIHTDGLFGSKFIELEPGGEEEMLKDGSSIDMTQSAVVVEELLDLIIAEGKAKRAANEQ